jgi:hypothetical protein
MELGSRLVAALFYFLGSAAWADDEVVDLGSMDTGARSWNPYQFEREPWLLFVPVLIFAVVSIHLFRRERRQRRRREQAEGYFND